MTPLAITAYTATTAAGKGTAALEDALVSRRSGLVFNDYTDASMGVPLPTWIGRVADLEDASLPDAYAALDCRNHRLAWMAIHQDEFIAAARAAVARYGPTRVAVLLGTSTSTIAASESVYREFAQEATRDCARDGEPPATLCNRDLHHLHATTAFVRDLVGARGPCATVSTACSSSAKVFAQAARLIAMNLADAAIVAGVDSLAASTLFGFRSLGLVSEQPCRPFDVRRDGINIGEAAGFALIERVDQEAHEVTHSVPLLIGYGESSDAFHMSSPHPEGLGARLAIAAALDRAGISAGSVDYLNLHGTATPKNDAIEAALIAELFPASTHASSTKGWTGHTLGAAGIVEAIVALVAMRTGIAPGCLHAEQRDPVCGPQIHFDNQACEPGIALSNAFAFGGNNCVLAFARDAKALHAARDRCGRRRVAAR